MLNKIAIGVGVTGGVLLIVSLIVGFWVLPDYINNTIEEEVALKPLSDVWDKWTRIERPLYFDVYMYNITNPDEVENGELPLFEEIGPYSYHQRRRKVNITLESEQVIEYEQVTYYFFDEQRSGSLSPDDAFTIINLPYVSVITGVNKTLSSMMARVIANNPPLSTEEFILRKNVTVRELLFDGMDVSVYTGIGLLEPYLPEEFNGGLFGLYRGNNASSDGVYRMHTGVGDSASFGQILTWKGESDMGYWHQLSECDEIKGSDGTIFPPFVDKETTLQVFSSDVCRSLPFTYSGEEKVQDIKGYKFVLPQEALQSPLANSDNACYCINPEDCWASGIIDISSCKSGAPIMLSTPHFLDGSPILSENSGLVPTRNAHETTLVVEPNSGVLLKANKRIQVNVNFKKIEGVVNMFNTPDMIFPLLWIDENVVFTGDNAAELKDLLLTPKKTAETWRWVALSLGIVAIIAGIGLFAWNRFGRNSHKSNSVNIQSSNIEVGAES